MSKPSVWKSLFLAELLRHDLDYQSTNRENDLNGRNLGRKKLKNGIAKDRGLVARRCVDEGMYRPPVQVGDKAAVLTSEERRRDGPGRFAYINLRSAT